MYANIFKYIEEQFDLIEMFVYIRKWQQNQEWDFPNWILNDVPREYTEQFMEARKLYRGMLCPINSLVDSEGCSWSSDIETAKSFAFKNQYRKEIIERESNSTPILIVKEDLALNLSLLIDELKNYLNLNNIEDLFDEDEYLSPMNLQSCKIYNLNEVQFSDLF